MYMGYGEPVQCNEQDDEDEDVDTKNSNNIWRNDERSNVEL